MTIQQALLVYVMWIPVLTNAAIPELSPRLKEMAMVAIEHAYREDFKQSETEARRIIRQFPDHPAGYFFVAVVLDLRMTYYQNDDLESEFYSFCNQAILRGEKKLEKDPDDYWTRFFIAGAKGAKGTYESRYGRWITAFRNGWQGITAMRDLVAKYPDVKDVQFGLGTYDYWRSALTKQLWWMPGVEDKRTEAISRLYVAADSGIFVRQASAYHLIAILCNEKKYDAALGLCEKMAQQYPASLLFSWGHVEALFGLQRFEEAEKMILAVKLRIEQEQFKNNYCLILAHYWLAKINTAQKKTVQAHEQIKSMFSLPVNEDTRKRLSSYFNDAMAMKR